MSTTGASDLLLAPEEVTFEVERFDWVDDARLEVLGRWSGVRGLRFVRPVLTVPVAAPLPSATNVPHESPVRGAVSRVTDRDDVSRPEPESVPSPSVNVTDVFL